MYLDSESLSHAALIKEETVAIKHEASVRGNSELILNSPLIELLVSKSKVEPEQYPLSKVVNIIHRSIPDDDLNEYQTSIKQFTRIIPKEVDLTAEISGKYSYTLDGIEIIYENIELPGGHFAEDFLDLIDEKFGMVDWNQLSTESIMEEAAVFCVSLVAAHIKPDGNLRSGVGLAKYIIDRESHKKLDIAKLNNRKVELKQLLDEAIVWLLPEEFLPSTLIRGVQSGEKISVNIKETRNNPSEHGKIRALLLGGYFTEIQNNIEGQLLSFEPDPKIYYEANGKLLDIPMGAKMSNLHLQTTCEKLAKLFEECLI